MRNGIGAGGPRDSVHKNRICVPDAPGNCARRARGVSDLRHGAGAASRLREGGAESGADEHDAALLGKRRADDTYLARRNGCVSPWRAAREDDFSERPDLDRVSFGDAGCALGRLAIFCAWMAVDR